MKIVNFVFTVLFLAAVSPVHAQIETPWPSPFCKTVQTVGLTDVTIEYSRPGVKDREIYGGLVPFNEPWRTGANAATKVTFSTDVTLGGKQLAEGEYALITVPAETQWELRFYPYKGGSWRSYVDDEDAEPVTVMAEPKEMDSYIESLVIHLDNLRNESATFLIAWDKTIVPVKLEVPTNKMVEESIESTMSGPSAGEYYAAASYYFDEGKDLDQALKWINTSLEKGGDRFWILRTKSLIQAELGDYKGAIETARKSKMLAEEADNQEYIRFNTENIARWSEM